MIEQPVLIIHFPRPPSANRMFMRQMTRRGRRDLTPEYKAWRDRAGWIVKTQIVGFATIACRFRVEIQVPHSRMDIDNQIKPILDLAQNLGIIANDGNAAGIEVTPTDRDDCMVAFWELPDMGGVRPAARTWDSAISKPRSRPKTKGLQWRLPL